MAWVGEAASAADAHGHRPLLDLADSLASNGAAPGAAACDGTAQPLNQRLCRNAAFRETWPTGSAHVVRSCWGWGGENEA